MILVNYTQVTKLLQWTTGKTQKKFHELMSKFIYAGIIVTKFETQIYIYIYEFLGLPNE